MGCDGRLGRSHIPADRPFLPPPLEYGARRRIPAFLPIHPLLVTKKKTTPKRVWSFAYTVDNCRVQKSALAGVARSLCRPLIPTATPRECRYRSILPTFSPYVRKQIKKPQTKRFAAFCSRYSRFARNQRLLNWGARRAWAQVVCADRSPRCAHHENGTAVPFSRISADTSGRPKKKEHHTEMVWCSCVDQ